MIKHTKHLEVTSVTIKPEYEDVTTTIIMVNTIKTVNFIIITTTTTNNNNNSSVVIIVTIIIINNNKLSL